MSSPPESIERVIVVGRGTVARALGENLRRCGHVVRFAVREPDDPDAVALDGAGIDADLCILAVPVGVIGEVVPRLGLAEGSILVDVTNPFGRPLPAGARSSADVVTEAAGDGVRVVKAFNVLGAEHMADPPLPDGHRPLLPVAGDDDRARGLVAELARRMGFDAVEVGGLEHASLLEEAARYWGLLAGHGGLGRDFVLVADHRSTGVDQPKR